MKIQNLRNLLVTALLVTLSLAASARSINNNDFKGRWCGFWDGVFEVCFIIDKVQEGEKAKYMWKESSDGDFKQSKKSVKRINRNTLLLENIYLILDDQNADTATAVGIFQSQSRQAILKRKKG